MNEEANIPRGLQDIVNEALSGRHKATFARSVQLEGKSEKTEAKILVLSAFRLLLLGNKSPRKVENSISLLDISGIQSKNLQKLVLTTETKRISLTVPGESGKECDLIIFQIILALSNIFPDVSVDKLIAKIEVSPNSRLSNIYDLKKKTLLAKDSKPCGNYSEAYRCWCDYRGLEAMEDVAWDVDNIYLSQDSREFCLSDFDHVDTRHLILILSALEHNGWFTQLNVSDVKMSPEILNEVRKILKNNSTIKKLVLMNSGIRSEILGKLLQSLLANTSPVLHSLTLSGNLIEDKGAKTLCILISTLQHGLVELQMSATAVTSRGINKIGNAFVQSPLTCNSLRVLDLSENVTKGEDISNLLAFFTKENALETIRMASIECSLENLISSLYPGCCKKLRSLDVSGNFYSRKHGKDAVCPQAWKQLFSSSVSLKYVNLSNCRLPPDAVKSVLLGIACNQTIKDFELNLSGNGLGEGGATEVLEVTLPTITNIESLDISDNGFDASLSNVLTKIGQNKSLKKLFIGKNLNNVKPKNVPSVVHSVVQLLQEETCPIESISLENMHMKADTAILLNALATNNLLKELDISGNQMGDTGARILSKSLLINKRLTSVYLDNNNITLNGFQDLAAALEKNYTILKIPTPLNDVVNAMRVNPEKIEAALKKISAILERNHNPRKQAVEQIFRLQQCLVTTSSSEYLRSSLDKLQDFMQRMTEIQQQSGEAHGDAHTVLSKADALYKDIQASQHLLSELQKVLLKSDQDNLIQQQLTSAAVSLQDSVSKQIQINISEMVQCAQKKCPAIFSEKSFCEKLLSSISQLNLLPEEFISRLVLEEVSAKVANTMNDLNLKVALFISESILDQLLCKCDAITASLNSADVGHPHGNGQGTNEDKSGVEMRKAPLPSDKPSSNSELRDIEKGQEQKHKSRMIRGLRPQSSFVSPHSPLLKPRDTLEGGDASDVLPTAPPRKRRSQDLSKCWETQPLSVMAIRVEEGNEEVSDVAKPKEGSELKSEVEKKPAFSVKPFMIPALNLDIKKAVTKHSVDEEDDEVEEREDNVELKQSLRSPTSTQKGDENTTPHELSNRKVGGDMALVTSEQKLQHLGRERPKRLKNVTPTHPMIDQRIEDADELSHGVDEFFAFKYTTESQYKDRTLDESKEKGKKISGSKHPAPLPPVTKPSKTKLASDSDV